jgi:hypothetical protein
MSRRSWLLAAGVAAVGSAGGLLAWWPGGGVSHAYTLAPESALPANLRNAAPSVREAYRFAINNRDVLRRIPCYCNCGDEHQSNAECYIKEVRTDGRVTFDYMSVG